MVFSELDNQHNLPRFARTDTFFLSKELIK